MHPCRICSQPRIINWLDLGPQALTNRFLKSPTEADYLHPCKLGVCRACGTIQLESPVPVEEMRPRFDWIFYNEPEQHLDDFAAALARLPGITSQSRVGGITYKDDSTLARLNKLGLTNTWRAEMNADLGINSPLAGIESVQAAMNPATAERLLAKHGPVDLLLFRHVLEHSYDIHEVLRCVRSLVKPSGFIAFEMPDARRAFDRLDYSTIWEEHIFYFTPTTLRRLFALAGLEVVFLESYHYTLENSLMVIARPAASNYPIPESPQASVEDVERAERFLSHFPQVRDAYRNRLKRFRQDQGTIAMLGAGHLSAAFLNFYELADSIAFIVDDNTNKQGLFMPGSRVPILPATALSERAAKLCLMSVRPEIEDVILKKNEAFIQNGGIIASVFPDSRYAFDKVSAT